jgi:hypothetical protein
MSYPIELSGARASRGGSAACCLLLLALSPSLADAQVHAPSRLCLAPASAQMTGVSADQAVEAVRETFTAFLSGPGLEVVPLTARTPTQVRQEAQLVACDATLFPSLRHQRKQGRGLLGRVAGDALQEVSRQAPTGGLTGSVTRAAADAAASAARDLSAATQARDELTLEYRLETQDGRALVTKKDKRRAEADGEDLLTPLVEEAAARIAEALVTRP